MFKRIIWIILDSVGIGEGPDADQFGDVGADTLGHIFEKIDSFDLPNLRKLGLGNIDNVNNIRPVENPVGIYGKARELSNGKDTTVGHLEMTGIYTKRKFPTYPKGFPDEVIKEFIKKTNIPGIMCNSVASGTEVINKYGDEHLKNKKPIVYTSADSVFQIACHENVYSPEKLYHMCIVAREILKGENAVARVIARPFLGEKDNFYRTPNRRDFSLEPQDGNLLDLLNKNNIMVYGIGKINDIFSGKGITKSVHTTDNMDGVDKTIASLKEVNCGLIFTNLVEFDSQWGHRRDLLGYGKGLKDFDKRLPDIINSMNENDLLIINSDHGCDPTFKGTDHTREYIPVLMYSKSANNNVNLHIMNTFADIGQSIADNFNIEISIGTSRLEKIWKNNITCK